MISREGLTDDLNTSMAERARAAIAGLLLLSLLALPFWPGSWPLPFVLLAAAFVANLDLVRAMAGHGGPWFAFKCLLYHQVYYVYSATVYVWCLFEYHVLGQKQKLRVTRN